MTEVKPSSVICGVHYNLKHYRPEIRYDWDLIKPGDTCFLAIIVPEPAIRDNNANAIPAAGFEFKKKYGIQSIRG